MYCTFNSRVSTENWKPVPILQLAFGNLGPRVGEYIYVSGTGRLGELPEYPSIVQVSAAI